MIPTGYQEKGDSIMRKLRSVLLGVLLTLSLAVTSQAYGQNCCFTTDGDGDGDLDCVNTAGAAACTALPGADLFFPTWTCISASGQGIKTGDWCKKKSTAPPLQYLNCPTAGPCTDPETVITVEPPQKFRVDWWNAAPAALPQVFAWWATPFAAGPSSLLAYSGYLSQPSFTIAVGSPNVIITLGNVKVLENTNELTVFIGGSGTAPNAANVSVVGEYDSPPPDSPLQGRKDVYSGSSVGLPQYDWVLWIEGRITPQPDRVIVTIPLPAGSLDEVWAGDYCHDSSVPTVSEWGLVAMLLLVASAGTVVILRRREALA
jgi:hypothetical protein